VNQASAHSIRRLAEKYTAAWCSQDPDLVAACYAKDGSLTVNHDPPAQGRKAISEVARGFMTGFPDMQVSLDDLELKETGAIYHWTLTGNNNGPGGTGRSVRISGYEIWQIDSEGLIASSEGHFDNADYFRQLGL
jgi:ketosteroid isomerase-like protein